MSKPFRWSRFNRGVRTLIVEHGWSVERVKEHTTDSVRKQLPNAQPSELAMHLADIHQSIDEVAERINKEANV